MLVDTHLLRRGASTHDLRAARMKRDGIVHVFVVLAGRCDLLRVELGDPVWRVATPVLVRAGVKG